MKENDNYQSDANCVTSILLQNKFYKDISNQSMREESTNVISVGNALAIVQFFTHTGEMFTKEKKTTNVNSVEKACTQTPNFNSINKMFMKEEKITSVKSVENFLDKVLTLKHIRGNITN